MQILTAVVSAATCAVSGWMAVMYVVLRHPGYQGRAVMAALVCVGAAALVTGRPPNLLRLPLAIWGAALGVVGVAAFRTPGDDGWAVIAAALFVVEGGLAVLASAIAPRAA